MFIVKFQVQWRSTNRGRSFTKALATRPWVSVNRIYRAGDIWSHFCDTVIPAIEIFACNLYKDFIKMLHCNGVYKSPSVFASKSSSFTYMYIYFLHFFVIYRSVSLIIMLDFFILNSNYLLSSNFTIEQILRRDRTRQVPLCLFYNAYDWRAILLTRSSNLWSKKKKGGILSLSGDVHNCYLFFFLHASFFIHITFINDACTCQTRPMAKIFFHRSQIYSPTFTSC